jgi:type VI secretion system protein ImpD
LTEETVRLQEGGPKGPPRPPSADVPVPASHQPAGAAAVAAIANLHQAAKGGDPAAAALEAALAQRFGPDFAGAWLDRDTILASLDREVAAVDQALSRQVNAILHHPLVQRLEAGWRGLLYLVNTASEGERAQVKVLSVSWRELVRDLERASEFDQSVAFRKIYTEEFGTLGGEPFGLVIGDYEIQHRPTRDHPTDDIGALTALAEVAAASLAPIILGASPRIFQLDSFRDLGRPANLETVFSQPDYQRWHGLRTEDDTKFIGLALPRILLRAPYAARSGRSDGFCFSETSSDASAYLWGNAAFAFGAVVLRAYAESGWFADLRGAPRDEMRGGIVVDLPVISFATDSSGVATKPSVEYMVTESQDRDLTALGFIVLRKRPYTDLSVFYGNPSLWRPPVYDRLTATVNARLSGMLQYTLCVARFAHYIKVLGRNRIGSILTADECQAFLNNWLLAYCEGSDNASPDIKARRPLREASIDVRDWPGKPGSYHCTVHLRPHYQLDDIVSGVHLVTELAPQAAA